MRRRPPIVATVVAVCLSLTASFNPAFASGLIPTEKIVAAAPRPSTVAGDVAQTRRASLQATLVDAGVEPVHARSRVDALTDAEIGELSQHIATAPAGGLWFMPFLLVAAVIGVLIGTRESQAGTRPATTNLFGQPLATASTP